MVRAYPPPSRTLSRNVFEILTVWLLCGVDFTQRWVVNDNWTYTADLAPLTKKLGRDTRALLVFFGIDTIANIVSVFRASR